MAFGAYQRGNFLYALLEAERRLDGNPKDTAAMTLIGEIYRDGAAVARNDSEASRWFRLAGNLGDPQAAYELGVMLVQGENGVAKDPATAKAQFERAAAKNHPGALYNLGVMALQGMDGKTPDYNQAAQYFLRAANLGGSSDVITAAYGALAGAHYGVGAIPAAWRANLAHHELIERFADRLLACAMLG